MKSEHSADLTGAGKKVPTRKTLRAKPTGFTMIPGPPGSNQSSGCLTRRPTQNYGFT